MKRTSDAMDRLGHDVRAALRSLRSSHGYAIWVVGSLAIGMAVTIAALGLLNATMFLPFAEVTDQSRLVRVVALRNCGRPDCWTRMSSPADYRALRESLNGAEGLAAYTQGEIAAALPQARSMRGMATSASYFDVLGVRPAAGRMFAQLDEDAHAAVAVVAHHVWMRELAGDPSAIGRSIRIGNRFVQIVGVAPPRFIGITQGRPGRRGPDVWLPIWMADEVMPLTAAEQRRQRRDVEFVARMREGVDVAQVQAEAAVVAQRMAGGATTGTAEVRRVWRVNPENWQFGLIIVLPIPILVLVIACVNAANLMLARGSQRQREIAIRLAIGAARGRIVRQLLVESAVLALVATAVALPIAWAGLQLASTPLDVPIPFDPTVLALTILTAAGTALAFGLAPAVRISAQRPADTLGVQGRGDAAPRQSRLRTALVIAQVALSLGLLATAWQLVATVRSQAVSGGTPGDRLLIARFDLRPVGLDQGEMDSFYRELVARASQLPGVEAAGLARHTSVWTFGQGAATGSIVVWRAGDAPDEGRSTPGGYAGGELFDAIGVRVLAGRSFTEADRQARPQVAIVNQPFARTMGGPAVGSVIRVASRSGDARAAIDVRIVGVIEPVLEPRQSARDSPAPKVYLPGPLEPEPALALYLRAHQAANTLMQPVRQLVDDIAPRVPIVESGSLDELNERSFGPQLWLARAAAVLGIIGLLLATAGLYGVTSCVVAMRSREIAIRMAIGARPGVILNMVLGQSMRMAMIGLLIGGGAAAAISRIIQAGYHGIVGIDAAAFGGAAVLFLGAMLLAGAVPAVRASRLDPIARLRDA